MMKKLTIPKFLVVFVFFAASHAFAGTADDFSENFPDDATTVSSDIAAWCEVGGHRFRFEQAPLDTIIRSLGRGHLDRTGDAGSANFDYFVNYTDGIHLITFSSNNDMGGEDHDLQGVAIRELSASDHAERLPHLQLPINFPFGSSDISFSALAQKLGRATGHHGVYAYTYSTKYRMHDNSGRSWAADDYAYLEIRVRKGVIVAFSVDRTDESE